MPNSRSESRRELQKAIARSKRMQAILCQSGAINQLPSIIGKYHNQNDPILIITDKNIYETAGRRAESLLGDTGREVRSIILHTNPRLEPTIKLGDQLAEQIREANAIPVAVGSGVVNDLVKYAAHMVDRAYSCVATAASIDGYAASGAPMSDKGFRINVPCDAPVVIIADLDIIKAAPNITAGWGYGDLAGKVSSGADWMLADALDIEPINESSWQLVHEHLRDRLSNPEGVANGEPDAIEDLFIGLSLVGIAMELHNSSRPASGSEHQIAHMWEMEGLSHKGIPIAHGACVAVATVSVLGLYDWLLSRDLGQKDIDRGMASIESFDDKRRQIEAAFPVKEIMRRSIIESEAKHIEGDMLRKRLEKLVSKWPELKQELANHLMRRSQMQDLLRRAGVATSPEHIGVSSEHLKKTILASRFIRNRYTVLDTLSELGLLQQAVDDTVA